MKRTNKRLKGLSKLQKLKQRELQLELSNGKVLKNHTNGYVFFRPLLKTQIKINTGKNRGKKAYSFSNPKFWVVLPFWEGVRVKALYYLGLKRFI